MRILPIHGIVLLQYPTAFKIDTGAEVTVITEKTAEGLNVKHLMKSSKKKLFGADRRELSLTGKISCILEYGNKSTIQDLFVIKQLSKNLLGLPAIKVLEMIKKVDTVEKSVCDYFPNLFSGLGTLRKGEYKIKIKPEAKPFALFTARHVRFSLREKVQKELLCMEESGVISKAEQPSAWCAAMVVVLKKSGAIRICVDHRPLNEVVLREVHPLPKVDESLAQLPGAVMFSKLDANSGFWQTPLSTNSKQLTTFITPFSCNKLSFGTGTLSNKDEPDSGRNRRSVLSHG